MDSDDIVRAIGNQETAIRLLTDEIRKIQPKLEEALSTCQSFEEHQARVADHEPRIQKLEKVAAEYEREEPNRRAESKYLNDLRTTLRAFMIAAGLTNSIVLALIGLAAWLLKSGYLRVGP
jgi:ferric-dicitrate binding protein FerR (iron transport regulator)